MKYYALFSILAVLAACSDDGTVGPSFDPDVPPQNVQVVSGDSDSGDVRNTISWIEDPAATGYVVFVSDMPGVTANSSQVVPSASGTNFVIHSGIDVVAGVPLYYKVQALSGTHSSVLSAEVTGTPQQSVTADDLNDVAWNGTDTLIAVGEAGGIITSRNALTERWFQPGHLGLVLSAVTWESNNNQFLIVGENLKVLIDDGVMLQFQDMSNVATAIGNTPDLQDVAWVFDRYVAVGENSLIITSADGTSLSWIVRNGGNVNDSITLNGVAANNNGRKTVVVGTNGTLLTSDDRGQNWMPWVVTDSNDLNDVTWDGSQFIVVGANGTMYTSAEGVSWQKSDLIENDTAFIGVTQWNSVLPVDAIPAAVGSSGGFFVFPDSTTAIEIPTGTAEQLSAIIWVDDGVNAAYFVIVGHDGVVLTSQLQ